MKVTTIQEHEDFSDVLLGLTSFFLKYGDTMTKTNQSAIRSIVEDIALTLAAFEKKHLN
jgi:hypothetical protein